MSLLRTLTSNIFEWKSLLPTDRDLSSLNLLGSILKDITIRRWGNQDWTKKRVDLYSASNEALGISMENLEAGAGIIPQNCPKWF